MDPYAKSDGAIFPSQKKHDKMPDYAGSIDITKEQITALIELGRAGHPMKLRLAMWERKAKDSGKPYKYVSAQPEKPKAPPAPEPSVEDIPF